MSALGGKADMTSCGNPLSRSLLGVERTWPIATHISASDPKPTRATPPLRFLAYGKFETPFEGALAAFMVPAERLVRHAAHYRKQVRGSSGASPEATASL